MGDWGITLFADPRHVRSDVRLVRQAIREGWRCSRRKRKRIMAGMGHLVMSADVKQRQSARLALKIMRTVALADSLHVDGLMALYKLQKKQEAAQAEKQKRTN